MPSVHDVLTTSNCHVHDVLTTLVVHDVLTIDTYLLRTLSANPKNLSVAMTRS